MFWWYSMIEVVPRYHEVIHCLVCGSTVFDPVYRRNGYTLSTSTHRLSFDLSYQHCSGCGLVFMAPQLSQQSIDQYLLHIAFTTMEQRPSLRQCGQQLRPVELETVRQHLEPGADVLEVGSGDGKVLYYLQEVLGYRVCGIDLSETYVEYTRNALGLDTRMESLESFEGRREGYDLILSKHTFEHLADPVSGMRKVREMLKPGGLFILVVPSLYSALYTLRDMFSAHNFLFTSYPMRRVLAEVGFEVISSDEGEELSYILRRGEPVVYHGKAAPGEVARFLDHALNHYERRVGSAILRLNEALRQWRASAARLVIFGAGEHTATLLEQFDFSGCDLRFIVDSNHHLRNSEHYGYRVVHPDDLAGEEFDRVVISSHEYQEEIATQLTELGYGEKIYRIYRQADLATPLPT